MGVPSENMVMFITHLILILLSTAIWVLCAPILEADFPEHIVAWIVFETCLAGLQTLYGIWAAIIDSRDTTFYERKSETFFLVDLTLFVMNVATSVTGAVYWRNGDKERQLLFNSVVVLSWLTLVTLAFITGQDRVRMSSN